MTILQVSRSNLTIVKDDTAIWQTTAALQSNQMSSQTDQCNDREYCLQLNVFPDPKTRRLKQTNNLEHCVQDPKITKVSWRAIL